MKLARGWSDQENVHGKIWFVVAVLFCRSKLEYCIQSQIFGGRKWRVSTGYYGYRPDIKVIEYHKFVRFGTISLLWTRLMTKAMKTRENKGKSRMFATR